MKALAEQINDLDAVEVYGRVVGVRGLLVELVGPIHAMSLGSRVSIETPLAENGACIFPPVASNKSRVVHSAVMLCPPDGERR